MTAALAAEYALRPHTTDRPRDRPDVDDRSGPPLLDQCPRGVLGAEEHAANVHREGVVPVLHMELGQRSERASDRGVVDHAVETTKRLEGMLDDIADVVLG